MASLIAGLIGAVVFTPLGNRIDRAINPRPPKGETVTLPVSPTPIKTGERQESGGTHSEQRVDPRKEQLAERFDSFNSRFSAVEASLQQRARDLGGLSVKPEITASIQTTRTDLAEAKEALTRGDFDRAALRLKRVQEALNYLESL